MNDSRNETVSRNVPMPQRASCEGGALNSPLSEMAGRPANSPETRDLGASIRYCPGCGVACAGGLFCTRCGQRLGTEVPQERPVPVEPARRDSTSPESEGELNSLPGGIPPAQPRKSGQLLHPEPEQPPSESASGLFGNVPPAADAMRYMIACRRTGKPEFLVSFDRQELKIGQSHDCDIILAGDQYASRLHARITQANGQVLVEDLGSSNGTSCASSALLFSSPVTSSWLARPCCV